MAIFPGLPGRAGTRKVKPIWILLKQETVSGSGISRAICKSAPRSRQITMPVPHHSSFLQAGCPSCRPTNSVKALKANYDPRQNSPKLPLAVGVKDWDLGVGLIQCSLAVLGSVTATHIGPSFGSIIQYATGV